jgi:hypothetical protein
MLLDDEMVLHNQMDCVVHVVALLGEGVGGCLSLPAANDNKKLTHQSKSTAGDKEVSGRRRRQQIKRGGGPGRREAVV